MPRNIPEYIFGAVGFMFEESGPRESPCGTPDGRLGLPRHPETSLRGVGGGGTSEAQSSLPELTPHLYRQMHGCQDSLSPELLQNKHFKYTSEISSLGALARS